MLFFNILLYVFKFIHIISYSSELGFVSFILLYKLSRNVMEFIRLITNHLGFYAYFFIKFNSFAQRVIVLGLFNYFMYNVVTEIRVCSEFSFLVCCTNQR